MILKHHYSTHNLIYMKRSTKHYGSGNKKKADTHIKVNENTELMKFLLVNITHKNRNNIKSLLNNKQISVDGKVVTQFNHPLKPEQKVKIRWDRTPEEKQYRDIKIVFEDAFLIVIDKHSGILSIATDNEKRQTAYNLVSEHVKQQNQANKIFVVHRLDRDTSGLMIFAKSEKVQELLQETWRDSIIERTYIAVAEGVIENEKGTITSYLKESKALKVHSSQNPDYGQKAVTNYRTIKSNNGYSLLKVNLETGRKNQIRVHMQDLGHCIVGDKKYGAKQNPIGRLGLHAHILKFIHPINKKQLRFESPIPPKFKKLLKSHSTLR